MVGGAPSEAAVAMLSRLVDTLPEPAEVSDAEGRLVHVNGAFTQAFGYSLDEARGRRAADLLGETDEVSETIERSLSAGRAYAGEARCRTKWGTGVALELTVVPVTGEDGRLLGTFACRRDITARTVEGRTLRDAEARYRAIFENPAVKLLIDPVTGRIEDANRAAAEFYGWSRSELTSMRVQQINTLPDSAVRAEMEAASREHRQVFRFVHRTRSGELRPVEVFTGPVQIDGKTHLLSIVHDISERAALEKKLASAQRMDALGRLAGGVAHDFNNLLVVVLGSVRLLQRGQSVSADGLVHVERIEEAARRAADVTKQLLLFSRGEDLEAEPVEIETALRSLVELLRGSIGETITIELDVRRRAFVYLPRSSFDQVLLNLAVNARDAMPRGGRLTLSGDVVEVDASHPEISAGSYVAIEVRDTGGGMTDEVRARVFEPFFSTKPTGSGTGLGLAVSYGIVHRARGVIEIDSAPGAGTTMRVLLPRATQSEQRRTPRTRSGAFEHRCLTILVVEDEPAVRTVIARILEGAGHRVLETTGPREALLVAEREGDGIDLVLSDVVMPQMSGPELVRTLREARPTLKVLYVSGYAGDALDPHLENGVNVLPKPFDEKTLLAAIGEALTGGAG